MFTRAHKILIALLAMQTGLAIVTLTLTRNDDAAPIKEHPLLAKLDAAAITRIQIASKAGKPIDLVKHGSDWVIASGYDHRVPAAKIDGLLAPIAKLAAATPVATQATRHEQLHVADDDFERKLVITAGGGDTTLFIGGPVGSRRTALRIGGDPRVWPVTGLSGYGAGGDVADWMEDKYVDVPRDDIAKLTIDKAGAATTFERDGDHWKTSYELAAGETLDTNAIAKIMGDVGDLPPLAPGDPKRDASHPLATVTIEPRAQGSASVAPVVYDVLADGDNYWVKQRGSAAAVVVTKNRLADEVDLARDRIVKKPPPATATKSAPAKKSG